MKFNRMLFLVPVAILAVACGRDDSSKKVDDALNSDLSLAAQARPYTALDSISAAEKAYYPARQQTVVKHTKRDAAIGAATGAVLGAVTSRDKVKGAVIGGVAGAILGGVIGNNVDKTKR